jgi:hypothetical protein
MSSRLGNSHDSTVRWSVINNPDRGWPMQIHRGNMEHHRRLSVELPD